MFGIATVTLFVAIREKYPIIFVKDLPLFMNISYNYRI
jgi:hypothetical protein